LAPKRGHSAIFGGRSGTVHPRAAWLGEKTVVFTLEAI
jgi:hypothetical protein